MSLNGEPERRGRGGTVVDLSANAESYTADVDMINPSSRRGNESEETYL